jgi:hypothetical protein
MIDYRDYPTPTYQGDRMSSFESAADLTERFDKQATVTPIRPTSEWNNTPIPRTRAEQLYAADHPGFVSVPLASLDRSKAGSMARHPSHLPKAPPVPGISR